MTDSGSDLAPSVARQVADAADAFQARRARGEDPDPEEYAAQYPEAAEAIRGVLGLLRWAMPASRYLPAAAPEHPPPRVLGDFRLGREVGRGGMGVVYEAEQITLGRRVALKLLPFAALVEPRLLQRFHNEARAAAGLDHPHVVKVYAFGQERGVHYIAMQYIDGRPLSDLIRAVHTRSGAGDGPTAPPDPIGATASFVPRPGSPPGSPDPGGIGTAAMASWSTLPDVRTRAFARRVAELGVQAAEALDHAHTKRVIHRDIKPGNLLIDAAGDLWVSDFGLAKMTASDAGLTGTGDVFGTLRYMSPEQAQAKHDLVDGRTDIYALGATLYELLTGRPVADGADKVDILRRVTDVDPPMVRSLNRAVPVDLETVIHKCLRKERGGRYETARELTDDLKRFLADEPVHARPRSRANRAWRRVRSRPLPVLASAAVVIGVLIGVAMALGWRSEPPVPEQPPTPDELRAKREEEIRATLARGETYTVREFEPELKAYRWAEVINGQATGKGSKTGAVFESLGSGLFEVCSAPPCDSYRFLVRIRHTDTARDPRVGMYFGYRGEDRAGTVRRGGYFSLGYADRAPPGNPRDVNFGQVSVRVHTFHELTDGSCRTGSGIVGPTTDFKPPLPTDESPWREVGVEVRPDRVQAIWCPERGTKVVVIDQSADHLSWKLGRVARVDPHLDGLPINIGSGGGLGLYVCRGTILVSEITIRPLGPDE